MYNTGRKDMFCCTREASYNNREAQNDRYIEKISIKLMKEIANEINEYIEKKDCSSATDNETKVDMK